MKSKTLTITALVTIIIGAVAAAIVLQMGGRSDSGLPAYSSISVSSTKAGSWCTLSVLWNDEANVSGYIFGSNNTGTFANDTWVPFSTFVNSTAASATVARTLNGSIGSMVQWRVWCNDTSNNWRGTGLQEVFLDSDKVLLRTSMGNITILLFEDMPITSGNFRKLVKQGIYAGTIFHRVVHNFVIQGGDPTGTGQGDPSIPTIPDELPNKHSNVAGAVAMAKSTDPNSASSQFFINLMDNHVTLDVNYSVFGRVVAGMDVAQAIGAVDTGDDEKPEQDVTLISAQFVS